MSIAPEAVPLTRTVVLLVGGFIVACSVGLDGLLDLLNGTAQEVCLAHIRKSAGLNATALAKRSFLVSARRVVDKVGAMTAVGGCGGAAAQRARRSRGASRKCLQQRLDPLQQ